MKLAQKLTNVGGMERHARRAQHRDHQRIPHKECKEEMSNHSLTTPWSLQFQHIIDRLITISYGGDAAENRLFTMLSQTVEPRRHLQIKVVGCQRYGGTDAPNRPVSTR
jgi:hypothetical protein